MRVYRDREPDDDGDRTNGGQRRHHRPPRWGRNDHREQQRPHGDPGEPKPADFRIESRRIEKLGRGDAVIADHLERQSKVHRSGQWKARAPNHGGDGQCYGNRDHAWTP